MPKYLVTTNFVSKVDALDVLAGEVLELPAEQAEDLNKRAKATHPNKPEFLKSLEEEITSGETAKNKRVTRKKTTEVAE